MIRLRESQLSEVHGQRQRLTDAVEYLESEKIKEREQLDQVIVELHSQMSVCIQLVLHHQFH